MQGRNRSRLPTHHRDYSPDLQPRALASTLTTRNSAASALSTAANDDAVATPVTGPTRRSHIYIVQGIHQFSE